MASPMLSIELAQEAVDTLARHGGNQTHAATALGVTRGCLQHRLRSAAMQGVKARVSAPPPPKRPDPKAPLSEEDQLRNRVFELEAQIKGASGDELTDEYVRRKIIGLTSEVDKLRVPNWLVNEKRGKSAPGAPSTMWSDWHWGEVVQQSQIGGVNAFDIEIAQARAKRLVDKVVYLLRHHVVNPEFPGIVVNLGGDMVTGDIHDELTATNAAPVMPVVLDLFGVLRWAIGALADEFGAVFVPCVTGNHGRNTRKPRAKDRNYTNFDWLLYQFLARSFEPDKRVTFYIPDGPDALYRVYHHRYLLTHGDQFRGGDGQIGAIGPITRGFKRKLARNTAIGMEYDTMLLGHWHQYMPLTRYIVNGSLKGYDEYANANNFEFELPTQALWLTHPERGITMHMPIYLEDPKYVEEGSEWVAWKAAT